MKNIIRVSKILSEIRAVAGLLINGLGCHRSTTALSDLLSATSLDDLNYLRGIYADEVDAYCAFLLASPSPDEIEEKLEQHEQQHELMFFALVYDRSLRLMYLATESGIFDGFDEIDAPEGVTASSIVRSMTMDANRTRLMS